MSLTPTIREVHQALESLPSHDGDELQRMQVAATVRSFAVALRQSIGRAIEFAEESLLSEAHGVIADFPDLLKQSVAWNGVLGRQDGVGSFARASCDGVRAGTEAEHDRIEQVMLAYGEREAALRGFRRACLEGEGPAAMRQRLRALMAADGGAGAWVAQLAAVERDWIEDVRRRLHTSIDEDELIAFADETRRGGWAARIDPEFVRLVESRAQPLRDKVAQRRFAALASELCAARAADDLAEVDRLERMWAELQRLTGVMPNDDVVAAVAPIFAWSAETVARREREANHARALDELDLLLLDQANAQSVLTAWTRIRDAAMPVPEGLELRAIRFIQLHEEREARRHRLQLIGGVAAMLVLGGVLTVAVVAFQKSTERRAAVDAVIAAIEANDGDRAVSLAEGIEKAHPGALNAAERGALDAAVALRDRLVAVEARADRELAAADEALAAQAPLPRVALLETSLRGLLAEAGLSNAAKTRIELTLVRCTARRDEIAGGHDTIARAAMADADHLFKAWPPPSQWSARERADPMRWEQYKAALDKLGPTLAAAKSQVSETERASKRLEPDLAAVKDRLDEATEKMASLDAALRQLDATEIGREITSEQQFIDRIKSMLKGQTGVVLGDLGLRSAFEESDQTDDAMLALAEWRETLRPSLLAHLGPEFEVADDPAVAQKVLVEIESHLRKYPESPLRIALEALRDRQDPAKRQLVTTVEDVVAALELDGYAGLQVLNLRQQGRFFYRRASVDGGPTKGALEDALDLIESPDKLGTASAIKADQVRGEAVASPVSVVWADGLSRLRGARVSVVVPAINRMLIEIAELKPNAPGQDALMQLAALANLSEIAIDGLGQPVDADRAREVRAWIEQIRKQNAGLLSLDWVKAAYAPEQTTPQHRREAAELVRNFPLKRGMTLVSSSQRLGGLSTYSPIGVMLAEDDKRGTRRVVLWRPAHEVLAISQSLDRSTLVPIRVTSGTASDAGLALSRGPILLYRDEAEQSKP
ncbi:MAG: hypothetical protein FJ254_02625 [Phycisphaerae bacterium]|nr:hypothetical protein [Phycisphaerae bacterium]